MEIFKSCFLESSATKYGHVATIKKATAQNAAANDTSFHSCTFPSNTTGMFSWKLELVKQFKTNEVRIEIRLCGTRNTKRQDFVIWYDLFIMNEHEKAGILHLPYHREKKVACTSIPLSAIPAGPRDITFGCNIAVIELPQNEPLFTGESSSCIPGDCASKNVLKKIHEDMKYSDVVISSGGREFQAHKSILSARSPVFSAMFENGFQEGRENRVEITGIELKTMEWFLRFLYTDELPPDMDVALACKLLVVSDRYDVARLKNLVEAKLTLNLKNVVEVLQLAHLHSVDQLKKAALEFVVQHFQEVSKTDEWKELRATYITLMDEVMDLMSRKLNE